MTSFLAGISGKFRFPFLISTFTPVLIFLFLVRILIVPKIPHFLESPFWEPVKGFDDGWEFLTILFVAIVLSVLLGALNTPLIRMYEGYPWENWWIGQRRIRFYQRKYDELAAERDGWISLRRIIRDNSEYWADKDEQDMLARSVQFRGNQAALEIRNAFPEARSILPTQLGNVIRAFETYPRRQYGMGAITLYPRLVSVVDEDYSEVMQQSKSSLDFMLNSATLAGMLSGVILLTSLLYPASLVEAWSTLGAILQALVFLLLARWFYQQGLGAAASWGNTVKAAFDLYRNDLVAKLGFDYAPKSVNEERRLWENITRRIAFGDPQPDLAVELMPYVPLSEPDFDVSNAEGIELESLRTLEMAGDEYVIRIFVRNSTLDEPASGITIRDTLPEAYYLTIESLSASKGGVAVTGNNPYKFTFDATIKPGDFLTLCYRIRTLPTQCPACT